MKNASTVLFYYYSNVKEHMLSKSDKGGTKKCLG